MTKNNYSDNLSFKLTMILSLFSLFVSNHLNSEYFYFACYGLILTFGIIHGANDILILIKRKKKTNEIVLKNTIKYLSIVILISFLFFNFSEFHYFFLFYLVHTTLVNNNGQYLEVINPNQFQYFTFSLDFLFFPCYFYLIKAMFQILFLK